MTRALPVALALILTATILAGCTATNTTLVPTAPARPTYPPASAPPASPTPRLSPPVLLFDRPAFVSRVNETAMTVTWGLQISGDLEPGQAVYSRAEVTGGGADVLSPDAIGVGQERDAEFSGLMANTTYSISILAHIGGAPASPMYTFQQATTNQPGAGAEAPGNVTAVDNATVDGITPNAADVRWTVHGDGAIQSWAAYGTSPNTPNSVTPTEDGSGLHALALEALDQHTPAGTHYYLTVFARAGGHTVHSDQVDFTTPPDSTGGSTIVPARQPNPTSSAPPGSESLSVQVTSWAPQDLTHLTVTYEVSGTGTIQADVETVTDGNWAVAGSYASPTFSPGSPSDKGPAGPRQVTVPLASNTLYHFRVIATNDGGSTTATTPDFLYRTGQSLTISLTHQALSAPSCGGFTTMFADPTSEIQFVVRNDDTHTVSHEWILITNTNGATTPSIIADSWGFITSAGTRTAQFEQAPQYPTQSFLPVSSDTTSLRMAMNQYANPSQPFWLTDTASGSLQYDHTGRPSSFIPPTAGSYPDPGGHDTCGILNIKMAVESSSVSGQGAASPFALDPASTCNGVGFSPALNFLALPAGKASTLALQMVDTTTGQVLWTWWDADIGMTQMPAAAPLDATAFGSHGGVQGTNDKGTVGYSAPCPAAGERHRYDVTLYALNQKLGLPAGASVANFTAALNLGAATSPVVAQADLISFFPS
ncbi:MAG: YbhB/YbcL family Raf kinase inhibitor-like protein [Thermoplasmatota archaeon]